MTKTETKHTAQDFLIDGMLNAILAENEAYEPDQELIDEMRRQAIRVCNLFNIPSKPGLKFDAEMLDALESDAAESTGRECE